MGQSTSYRLRWPAALGDLELLQAMMPAANLPLSEARAYGDPYEDVSLVAPGVSIQDLVPAEDVPGPAHWSYDGTTFTFTADLLNEHYRHDESPFAEKGEPSRRTVLLTALAQTCGAADGMIVGAWMGEHSETWNPMAFKDGRLMRVYVQGWHGDDMKGNGVDGKPVQHDGRLPDGCDFSDHGTVTIPVRALRPAAS